MQAKLQTVTWTLVISNHNRPEPLQSPEFLQKGPFLVSDRHSIAIADFEFFDRIRSRQEAPLTIW